MEEDFEENYFIDTGSGNENLGNICESLFLQNGKIGYYELAKRVTEPEQTFDENFGKDNTQDFCQ